MAPSKASKPELELVHLRTLEESHLQPMVRADRDRLAAILHESFTEIGASGHVSTRQDVLDHLPDEPPARRVMEEFAVRMLSRDIALTTYIVTQTDLATGTIRRSRRSSVWSRDGGTWRLMFHQGTLL